MKVKFDIKYRQQIESGEYRVETADGRQVRIVCWDAHNPCRENDIVALATSSSGEAENILRYYSNGHLISDSANVGNKDLMVVIPDEDERIKNIITDSVFFQYGAGVEYKEVLDYLDKLEKQKERKPAEWSEEDEKILHAIEWHVGQLDTGETINGFSGSDMLRVLKSIRSVKQEWSEDKYPKNIETDAVMFCFDNGFNVTPYQARTIAKHFYELGFKRIGNGKA